MIFQLTDIAILLVSSAACIYCFVLSRRLKALQNTKDGLGATIVALSKSISAMSSTKDETGAHAEGLVNQLAQVLDEAGKSCSRVDSATKTMDSKHAHAIRQVEAAKKDLSESLQAALEETKACIQEMTGLMRQMHTPRASESQAKTYRPDDEGLFESPGKHGA